MAIPATGRVALRLARGRRGGDRHRAWACRCPATNNAIMHLAPADTGAVAGLRGMFRQAGGITGVAVVTAVIARSARPGHRAGVGAGRAGGAARVPAAADLARPGAPRQLVSQLPVRVGVDREEHRPGLAVGVLGPAKYSSRSAVSRLASSSLRSADSRRPIRAVSTVSAGTSATSSRNASSSDAVLRRRVEPSTTCPSPDRGSRATRGCRAAAAARRGSRCRPGVRTWCRVVAGSLPSTSAISLFVRASPRHTRRMRIRRVDASARASSSVAGAPAVVGCSGVGHALSISD